VGTRWSFLVVATVFLILNCFVAYGEEADYVPEYVHYVNEEFEFSIDYPEVWLLEEISPDMVGIKPEDSKYNQIQISVYDAEPIIGVYEESFIVSAYETSLRGYFDALGAYEPEIIVNERASGVWDWVVRFSVIYEDTPLQGGELIKERYISEDEFLIYSLFYMHSDDWPDGFEVIDSFTIAG
jgi:hypothetical protein